MLNSLITRIKKLENRIGEQYPEIALLDTGEKFECESLLDYMFEHGRETEQGKIIGFQIPEDEKMDAISKSIYEFTQEVASGAAYWGLDILKDESGESCKI